MMVGWQFLLSASICFAVIGLSVWRDKTLGLWWQGGWIAYRSRTPILFWYPLAIWAALGCMLTYPVIAYHLAVPEKSE